MPGLPPSAAILAFPERPEDRLRRALRALDVALDDQAEAMAGLRRELGALSGAIDGLGNSLQVFSAGLQDTPSTLAVVGATGRA